MLLRVIAAVVGVVAVAGVALALLLPRVLASDAVRGRIQTAAAEALGREVRYAELEPSFFPPALLVQGVAVAGASAQAPPLVEAERATLRVALLPLLSRRLRIDVALEGGRVQLEDMALRGRVDIEADVEGGLASPRGRFDIDATEAEIRYGGMFEKPPGDSATVTGKIVTESDGTPGVDDVRLKIRSFKANARSRSGTP
jgi:uncharacterized protein YhdP